MRLYRVTVQGTTINDYMILANDETQASRYISKKYEEWDYTPFIYVSNIKLIAVEGENGEDESPMMLLNAT